MKKLLSILGAISLAASASSAVVACTNNKDNKEKETLFNNDINNILGAGFGKAQGIILDAEFGISQKVSNEYIGFQRAEDVIKDFNTEDASLNEDSRINDVIKKYIKDSTITNKDIDNKNVEIENKNGELGGLASIIHEILKTLNIPNQLEPVVQEMIDSIILILNNSKSLVNSENAIGLMNALYDPKGKFGEVWKKVVSFLNTNATAQKVLKTIYDAKEKINDGVIGVLNNAIVQNVKNYITNLTVGENNLQGVIYENKELPKFKESSNKQKFENDSRTLIKDIKVTDVKKEIFESIHHILNILFNEDEKETSDLSTDLANIISKLINKENIKPNIKSDDYYLLVQEGLRIITIFNAYFNLFDNLKDKPIKDKDHLFDNESNGNNLVAFDKILKSQNGEYKTLGEASQYVKDKAINLGYFLQNINYYFGSLKDKNEQSTLRAQQGLFIFLVDSYGGETENKSNTKSTLFSAANSSFIDLLTDTGIKVLEGMANQPKLNETIVEILKFLKDDNHPNRIESIKNIVLKPLILGLVNGDDFNGIINIIHLALQILENTGSIPDSFMPIIKQLRIIASNITNDSEIGKNLFGYLFNGNLRTIFKGSDLISEDMIDKYFGDEEANLSNLINRPLNELLALFNVRGFENGRTPILGDSFTRRSVVELISIFASTINSTSPNQIENNWKYDNSESDKDKSLKLLNLNLKEINSLITSILGETPEKNIISKILKKLIIPPEPNEEKKDKYQINFKWLFEALGMKGINNFKKDSFLNSMLKLSLPLLNDEDEITITKDVYKVDLFATYYSNAISILSQLNKPGDYSTFIENIIQNKNSFEYSYNPEEIEYFEDNKDLIKSVKFDVIFKNPITRSKDNFHFKIERNSNIEVFNFTEMITEFNIEKGDK